MSDDDADFDIDDELDPELAQQIEELAEIDQLWEMGVAGRIARAVWRDGSLHVLAALEFSFGLTGAEAFHGAERELEGAIVAILGQAGEPGGGRELMVRFLTSGTQFEEGRLAAESALILWAASTGYKRVWFQERIVEINDHPNDKARARAVCPICGHIRMETGAGFWHQVFERGAFPFACPSVTRT